MFMVLVICYMLHVPNSVTTLPSSLKIAAALEDVYPWRDNAVIAEDLQVLGTIPLEVPTGAVGG